MSASDDRVLRWLDAGLARLAEEAERGAFGPEAIGSPLSPPTFRDAIVTSAAVRAELDRALASIRGRAPFERIAMVLPSNVETVIVRPLVWALLARAEIVVRVSSRRPGVAAKLASILAEEDPALACAIRFAPSDRADTTALRALVEGVDRVHVWGSDETIAAFAGLAGEKLVPHGSGLSLALLTREASGRLSDLDALALDLARYDQRGCLSPQALLVEEGGALGVDTVAHALDAALARVEPRLPRGALTIEERAQERRYRDTAHAVGGVVLDRAGYAISVEPGELRSCPGLRNLAIHPMASAAIDAQLGRLGAHLKSLGVLDEEDAARVTARIASPGVHVVPFGAMQTPSLLAPTDGRAPWWGIVEDGFPSRMGAPRRMGE